MGEIRKQSIQNTFISYLGIILGFALNVYLYPKLLVPEEVGLVRILLSVAMLFAQVAALGFGNSTLKFFPFFRNKEEGHFGFLRLMTAVSLVGFSVISIIVLLAKPAIVNYYQQESPLIIKYFYYLFPLALGMLFFNTYQTYLRSQYQTVMASFLREFLVRFATIAVLLLFALQLFSFMRFMQLFLAINLLMSLLLIWYTRQIGELHFKPLQVRQTGLRLKEVLQYSLFMMLGNVSSMILITADSVILGHYEGGLFNVGIYTTMFYFTTVITLPPRQLAKMAGPKVADYWKSGNDAAMDKMYKRTSLINLMIGGILFIGIWVNMHNIFKILPPEYKLGMYVVLYVGIARLVDDVTSINGIILMTSKKYYWDIVFNIMLALLTIGTNLYFIPRYGIDGAAIASMISLMLYNIARLSFVWYFFKMHPFSLPLIWICVFGTFAYLVGVYLPVIPNLYFDIPVRSAIVSLVFFIPLIIFRISPDLNNTTLMVLKRLGMAK